MTKNTYVQAFAVALGLYADGSSLGYDATAAKYGFVSVGSTLTYKIGSNGSAFPGVGSSPTVLLILQTVDANFSPSTGLFYGGDQAKTSAANNVLNGINTGGDIALVSSDAATTTNDQPLITALHPLATGSLVVAIDALPAGDTDAEQARIDDAVSSANTQLAEFGLSLTEVQGDDSVTADIHIHFASTSVIGGAAQGVLGVTEAGGEITIVTGWDYYLGSDASAMGSTQYDFETVIAHELGHAIGLGHSQDSGSVMFPYLGTEQSRRVLTDADITAVRDVEDGSPEPLMAAGFAPQNVPTDLAPGGTSAVTTAVAPSVPTGSNVSASVMMVAAVSPLLLGPASLTADVSVNSVPTNVDIVPAISSDSTDELLSLAPTTVSNTPQESSIQPTSTLGATEDPFGSLGGVWLGM